MDHEALAEKMYQLGNTYKALRRRVVANKEYLADAQKKFDDASAYLNMRVEDLKDCEKMLEAIKEKMTAFLKEEGMLFRQYQQHDLLMATEVINGRKFKES